MGFHKFILGLNGLCLDTRFHARFDNWDSTTTTLLVRVLALRRIIHFGQNIGKRHKPGAPAHRQHIGAGDMKNNTGRLQLIRVVGTVIVTIADFQRSLPVPIE